jgi:hypothetical protein
MVPARMHVGRCERRVLLVACLLPLLVTACGVRQVYTEPGPPMWPSPTGTATFDYHAFVDALKAAGVTAPLVEEGGAPLLNRDVRVYQVELGGSGLGQGTRFDGVVVQVYEYPDQALQQADVGQISPSGSPIGDRMVSWVDQPNFWGRGRLIVLYVGREPAVIQLLDQVMGDPITDHGR